MSAKERDIDYKVYVQNEEGIVLFVHEGNVKNEMRLATDKISTPEQLGWAKIKKVNDGDGSTVVARELNFKLTEPDAGLLDFKAFLAKRDWNVSSVDISQAKGDKITAEYRDSWNWKWKSTKDVLSSAKFLNLQGNIEKIVEKI